jgi:hypothetical protein
MHQRLHADRIRRCHALSRRRCAGAGRLQAAVPPQPYPVRAGDLAGVLRLGYDRTPSAHPKPQTVDNWPRAKVARVGARGNPEQCVHQGAASGFGFNGLPTIAKIPGQTRLSPFRQKGFRRLPSVRNRCRVLHDRGLVPAGPSAQPELNTVGVLWCIPEYDNGEFSNLIFSISPSNLQSKTCTICNGPQHFKFVRYQTSISATIQFLHQQDNCRTTQYIV